MTSLLLKEGSTVSVVVLPNGPPPLRRSLRPLVGRPPRRCMRCERRQGWLLVLVLCWPVDSSRPVVRLPSVGVVGGSGGIPFADMAMRRGPPARGGPAGRRAWAATLVWSDDELHVLEVAEQMRRRGDAVRAGHMVAVDCPLPARLHRHDFLHCTQLDLRRWYAALLGRQWDGAVTTMADARALAGRWRRDGRTNRPNPRGTRGEQPTYRLFCRSHLTRTDSRHVQRKRGVCRTA